MMYTGKGTIKRSGKPVVAPSNADLVCVPPRGPALMAGSACCGPFETHPTVKTPP